MSPVLTEERREVVVRGIVQGVGFRPFVYALARRSNLTGLVRNDADGVYIEVQGSSLDLDAFVQALEEEKPALAHIEQLVSRPLDVQRENEFRIEESCQGSQRRALISPDVATCQACVRELFDSADRRYRYPFINCTNCGPRFTITKSVPYDRQSTTMNAFPMCTECRREYEDPANRRFHAQPNACPACGPMARLLDSFGRAVPVREGDAISLTAKLLLDGKIVAIKGLGGYHLACNPFAPAAVSNLRHRKVRQDKPFAVMARDLAQTERLCRVTEDEKALLVSAGCPVVLLDSRSDSGVVDEVAPNQRTLGIMLAYTPLHHLLLHDSGIPLVMTSGNRSDEPIAYRDDEALEQLGTIADYFLVHDRAIHMRCDDSVARVFQGNPYPVRRSRGMAPAPVSLSHEVTIPVLACGGELKSTFCLTKGRYAFLSHHIGDLENYETFRSFREGIAHYRGLFDIVPELVAYDLHPEFLSTQYARDLEDSGVAAVGIQHHEAHIASCLADNKRPDDERVIGVAFDGTGFGSDGTIWGGEFFEGSIQHGFSRLAHLDYVPLPGGEAAIREPWRVAVAHLLRLYSEEEVVALPLPAAQVAGERKVRLIATLMRANLNAPQTCSAGRLFDAVAALANVPSTRRSTYEGQAAIELEQAADWLSSRAYSFHLMHDGTCWVVETRDIISGVLADILAGLTTAQISARFHRTMAEIVCSVCERIRQDGGPTAVALSGGTWQNVLLLRQSVQMLEGRGFVVYTHQQVPTNDGGLSLGQAILADSVVRSKPGEEGRIPCA